MITVAPDHEGRPRATTPRRAFTLVEAVLVMTVIGILASIALPRYAAFVAGEQVQSAARRIVTDLALAQRRARVTGATQRIDFDVTAGTYTLANLTDPDRRGLVYKVSLFNEPYRARIVSAAFGGDASLAYNGYGAPDTGGTVVIAVGKYRQTVTIDNGTGKPQMADKLTLALVE